ncbi:ABC transporter ATP-binding protein [Sharpea azabuensis]|uniref:ABC transporter ATP-binding protein n=1 Tax=Sharpea azabuensis TaxID=322505 RepID=UPI000E9FA595|nr:ATP-binding cassette domain-containing protein [Sharpea azabuensis]HAJ15017.1 ABC transporter [Erysipelotrichaceae bacterium]HAV17881.1 ABC transporter [Erysipelotrichaceae bacterium]HBZ51200.1 ABC transporter [Erysipelotrichaceae bacterium]
MIEVIHLSKSFGNLEAVKDISFSVKKGQFFAFLGVNGAGKSTTISMITSELVPTRGKVMIDGRNVLEESMNIKKMIGVVFQDTVLDQDLTAYENLQCRAALYGIMGKTFMKRFNELVDIFDMGDFMDRPLKHLSGGQRRRIDIARALIHRPQLLILDEPTTGLDPGTRKMIWANIEKLRQEEGLTVFLTTHYMEEADQASYVVIIDHGRIAAKGTPHELKNCYAQDTLYLYDVSEDDVRKLHRAYQAIDHGYAIRLNDVQEATKLILRYPQLFIDYEIIKGDMDNVFLNVTGKKGDVNEDDVYINA